LPVARYPSSVGSENRRARPAPGLLVLLSLLLAVAAGCRSAGPPIGEVIDHGKASWYGPGFHGRRTASGERFDMDAMTAAHRTLAFGTVVEVRNLENGRRAVVRINDRGPFAKNRVLDVSREAARRLGMIGPGTALIEVRLVGIEAVEGSWAVQVGSFRERERALILAGSLEDRFSVEVETFGDYHRVRVVGFDSEADARKARRLLAADGHEALLLRLP
jgi:rare lipoprotein A